MGENGEKNQLNFCDQIKSEIALAFYQKNTNPQIYEKSSFFFIKNDGAKRKEKSGLF
jgi:hypothetical protein